MKVVGKEAHLENSMLIIQGSWMTSSMFLLQHFIHFRYKVMGNKSLKMACVAWMLGLVPHTTSSNGLVMLLRFFVFLAQ